MELETVIVLIIGLVFVSLISYKVFAVWNRTQTSQYEILHKKDFDRDFLELQAKHDTALKAAANWKHRYKLLQRDYDVGVDEEDLSFDLEDPEVTDEEKLSDLVKQLYPKLPKSVAKLIDRPELQEKLTDYAAKNPDGLLSLFDNFVKKTPKSAAAAKQDNPMEFGI